MIRKLMLTALVATGLAFVGTATAQAYDDDHHRGGLRGGRTGGFCPGPGFGPGFGRGFYRGPTYGGFGHHHHHRGGFRRSFYGGYPGFGYGGSGFYLQGRNFGIGFNRW